MTPSFLEKLLARLDRFGPDQVQPILVRLVREKGFLEKVFEALQEGVIVLSRDGHATFINRAAARFFGLPPTGMVGRPLNEIIPGLDWRSMVSGPQRSVSRDLEIFYPENRYLNLYAAPIIDEGESPGPQDDAWLGCVLLIRDLTQSRRLTEEKIESRTAQCADTAGGRRGPRTRQSAQFAQHPSPAPRTKTPQVSTPGLRHGSRTTRNHPRPKSNGSTSSFLSSSPPSGRAFRNSNPRTSIS